MRRTKWLQRECAAQGVAGVRDGDLSFRIRLGGFRKRLPDGRALGDERLYAVSGITVQQVFAHDAGPLASRGTGWRFPDCGLDAREVTCTGSDIVATLDSIHVSPAALLSPAAPPEGHGPPCSDGTLHVASVSRPCSSTRRDGQIAACVTIVGAPSVPDHVCETDETHCSEHGKASLSPAPAAFRTACFAALPDFRCAIGAE